MSNTSGKTEKKPKANNTISEKKSHINKTGLRKILLILLGLIMLVGLIYSLPKANEKFENSKLNIMKTFKNITPKDAETLIKQNKDLVIVDIRTPIEFRGGKIDKAINIDFQGKNFSRDLGELDKEKTYLFYCNSGNRTRMASEKIKELGFKNVYILEGGIQAWVDAGKEVNKPFGE